MVDELARRRADNVRRVAGMRRHQPPEPDPGPDPNVHVIVQDLRQIKAMVEEVMAEALILGDDDLIAGVGALILHVSDVAATAERVEGGD